MYFIIKPVKTSGKLNIPPRMIFIRCALYRYESETKKLFFGHPDIIPFLDCRDSCITLKNDLLR